jgi:hypothetical protein
MDIRGHVLFAIGALSALFWLTSGGHRFDWMSGTSAALCATAVVSLTALGLHERRHHAPFLPLDLLADRTIRSRPCSRWCSRRASSRSSSSCRSILSSATA